MKCTYEIFLEAWRGQIRRDLRVEVAMIYHKFVGTPTSRGHVQFPTWKFSNLLFFLPPPRSLTDLLSPSTYLNGLEASMILLTQPYIHLYCPRSLQVQSLTTNCTVWLLTHSPRCPSWYEPPTSPSLLTTNCPDSPRTSTDTGLNAGILKFQPSQSPASSPPVSPLLLFPGCDHCRGAAQGKLNLLSLLFASLLIVVIVIRVGAMS